MTTKIRLAVFDCDGTLVDSQHMINSCMIDAFKSVNLAPPPLSAVRRVVGLPLAGAIHVLCGNDDAAPVDEMVTAYSNAWQAMRLEGDLSEPLYEGIPALLEALRDDGWTLGVATGKSMRGLEATLAHHNLEGHFVTLQTADKARGKPDPQMLHFAMNEAGADVDNTVMIGDTTFDIEMANAASVRALGVAWGYHAPTELMTAGAETVAEEVPDLQSILKS